MNPTLRRWLWRVLGLAGVVFMILVVSRELRSGQVIRWPHPVAVVASVVLLGIGLWLSSVAWLRLLGTDRMEGRTHRADFFASQLGKYLPGGIWQPLGQVGLASERGVSGKRSSAAVVAHAGIQVAVGAALAFPFAFRGDLAPLLRVGATLALFTPIVALVGIRLAGRSARLGELKEVIGSNRESAATALLLMANLLAQGMSFALLASVSPGDFGTTVVAFGVAWTIGFLAIPFPAGLGVREAILVFLVPAAAATVVAASVLARVATIGTEFVLIMITKLRA